MGFGEWWSDAVDSLSDNFRLLVAVQQDAVFNAAAAVTGSTEALGDAPFTASEAERQNAEREGRDYSEDRAAASSYGGVSTILTAGESTATQVKDAAKTVAKKAGGLADFLFSGWGLATVGVGAVLILVVLPAAVEGAVKR